MEHYDWNRTKRLAKSLKRELRDGLGIEAAGHMRCLTAVARGLGFANEFEACHTTATSCDWEGERAAVSLVTMGCAPDIGTARAGVAAMEAKSGFLLR